MSAGNVTSISKLPQPVKVVVTSIVNNYNAAHPNQPPVDPTDILGIIAGSGGG